MLYLIKGLYFVLALFLNIAKIIDPAVTLNAELNGNIPFWTLKRLGQGFVRPDWSILLKYQSVILYAVWIQ